MNLIEAIKQNNPEEVCRLLNLLQSDPDALKKKKIDEADTEDGRSSLFWAAALGYVHFIVALGQAGADANKPDKQGTTPLFIAAYNGHAEAVTALSVAGADVNIPIGDNVTPVYGAAYNGHVKAIIALVAAGANVNTAKNSGLTPLIIAVLNAHVTAVAILLEVGADASIKTKRGTALDCALRGITPKKMAIIRLLEAHFKQHSNKIKAAAVLSKEAVLPLPNRTEQKNRPILPQFLCVPSASTVDANDLKKFLRWVAEGEQDKAEAILKSNHKLTLMSGDVMDLSKRTFTDITGFQYAVWALDWHMWTMIRKYLSDDDAREQAQGFKTGAWVQQHGVHANLNILIQAYQTTIDLQKASKYTESNTAWVQQVREAQFLLPAHVVNEYCHPTRAFYPLPNFKNAVVLPRSRITDEGEWFRALCFGDKLGNKFAVYRGMRLQCVGWSGAAPGGDGGDQKTVSFLAVSRVEQREALVTELKPRPRSARRKPYNICLLQQSCS